MSDYEAGDGATQIPVIWNVSGDQVVAVTPAERPMPGWTSLFSSELSKTLSTLTGAPRKTSDLVQVRTFTMRDTDLPHWDAGARKGPDGYSYGFVRDPKARFFKNLQFKEMAPGHTMPSAPPIDPATLAVAIALHQMQQTLARMEDQIDGVRATVEWLEERRKSRQAAELLTAVNTLRSVGRRCVASGAVDPEDLLRVAHLEQAVGTFHREILMELRALVPVLAFTNAKSAKQAIQLDQARISDLVRLDKFALDGLVIYQQLLFISKASDSRLSDGEVAEAKMELARMAKEALIVVKEIKQVDTQMKDRSILEYMTTVGIPRGRSDDKKLRTAANKKRAQVQKSATAAKPMVKGFIKSLSVLDDFAIEGRSPLMLVASGSAA